MSLYPSNDFFDPEIVPRCARDNLRGQKSLGPLKMSLEMAHKVIVPQKKIMSRSFLNSGTLIVIRNPISVYFSLLESSCEQVIRVTPSCLLQWGPDMNTTYIPVHIYVNK